MATSDNHRILTQVLELRLTSQAEALACQNALANRFRGGEIPGLSELLDRYAPSDRVLRLERMELDLGEVEGKDWQQDFFQRLVEKMEQALTGMDPRDAPRSEVPAAIRLDRAEVPFHQLLFFLEHGRLPWWGPRPDDRWPSGITEQLTVVQRSALLTLIQNDPRSRRRLIHHLNDDSLSELAHLAGLPAAGRVLTLTTPPGLGAGSATRRWREGFWMQVLTRGGRSGPGPAEGLELMEKILALRQVLGARHDREMSGDVSGGPPIPRPATGSATWHVNSRTDPVGGPVSPNKTNPGSLMQGIPPLPDPWRRWQEHFEHGPAPSSASARDATDAGKNDERSTGTQGVSPAPEAGHRRDAASAFDDETTTGNTTRPWDPFDRGRRVLRQSHDPGGEASTPGSPDKVAGTSRSALEDSVIYLDGAGVVLLHPFLNELFQGRRLLEGSDFRDEDARQRAVTLLGYIVYGKPDVPEHALLLAKLLCAMPWGNPLTADELDAEYRQAGDALLRAVLRHWKVLKSNSPEWLRQHFLLREGKLEPVDDGWKLTVERRAQDVLLGKLPWGVGLVHLPWMRDYLYVSWS